MRGEKEKQIRFLAKNESLFIFIIIIKAWTRKEMEREHFVLFFTQVKWIPFDIQHLPYAYARSQTFIFVLWHGAAHSIPQTSEASSSLLKCSIEFFCLLIQHLDGLQCVIQSSCIVLGPTSLFLFFLLFCNFLARVVLIPHLGPGFYKKNAKDIKKKTKNS